MVHLGDDKNVCVGGGGVRTWVCWLIFCCLTEYSKAGNSLKKQTNRKQAFDWFMVLEVGKCKIVRPIPGGQQMRAFLSCYSSMAEIIAR